MTLPSGEEVLNPMRVLPHERGSEVVFTVRRRAGMSDADFEADDLATLGRLVGGERDGGEPNEGG